MNYIYLIRLVLKRPGFQQQKYDMPNFTALVKRGVAYILPSMAKVLLGLFCYSNCIHLCSDSTHSVEFVLLVAKWT